MSQRFLFWIQSPLALVFGTGIFFSIPTHFTSGQKDDGSSVRQKLARIDYLGAVTLVRPLSLILNRLTSPDRNNIPLPLRPLLAIHPLDPHPRLLPPPHRLHLHRTLHSPRTHRPNFRPQITRRSPFLRCSIRNHGKQMVGPILYPSLRDRYQRLVSCFRGLDFDSYESWVCGWWDFGWWFAYQACREFLAVSPLSSHFLLSSPAILILTIL